MQLPAPLHSLQPHLTAAEDVAKVKGDGEVQQGLPLSQLGEFFPFMKLLLCGMKHNGRTME